MSVSAMRELRIAYNDLRKKNIWNLGEIVNSFSNQEIKKIQCNNVLKIERDKINIIYLSRPS